MKLDLGVITDSVSPAAGGLFESVRLPSIKLAQRGARVTVYGIRDEQYDIATTRAAWHGPKLEVCAVTGPKRLRLSQSLMRKIMAAEHQVLHLHGLWRFPSYVTLRWSRVKGRPTVISPRGMLDAWAVRNSAFKKRAVGLLYENRNLAGAAVLHALNRTEAEAIRTFGLNNPVAIIPNGIDMPSRTVTLPPPGFMMADDRRVLLFLGRLHGKKGILELIAAWRHVIRAKRAIEDAWRVAVAGWDDGGHEKVLAAAIREAGLERHVILVGPLRGERKAQALGNASAFILPSHSEGMPMAVLEAWAYGIPVFMTRACNLPQAFTAGAAFEIEAHAERMASVLIDVLDQPRLLATTGAKGYTFVGNNYTWDRIITDLQRLYAWVLGGGERPDLVV